MLDRDKLVETFIEVKLVEGDNDFLIVKETLSRIGIPSFKNGKRSLFQTCHILYKKGKYYIVHFKEMFMLDNKLKSSMTEEDHARKRCIARLLEKWGLVEIVSPIDREEKFNIRKLHIMVIPHSKKQFWSLHSKYFIGKVRNKNRFVKEEVGNDQDYLF